MDKASGRGKKWSEGVEVGWSEGGEGGEGVTNGTGVALVAKGVLS